MPKFLVRARETRVYHFIVEAADEEAAKDIVEELDDTSTSTSDQFDQFEVMDAAVEEE